MNPRLILQVAEDLAAHGGPAHCRSSTSRAYYAVHHVGVEALQGVVPIGSGPRAHAQVWRALMGSNDVDLARVGRDLSDLHQSRVDADYRLSDKAAEHPSAARTNLALAAEMIDIIDQVLQGSHAVAVKQSIQQHWTKVLNEPLGTCKPIP